MISSAFQNVRGELFAVLRHLRRSPGFAAVAIAILAVGIGANVAVFSIFESIVLRPLPYPASERLLALKSINQAKAIAQPALSLADFRDFRERAKAYTALAAYRPDFVGYAPRGSDPVQLVCGRVTEEFLDVFGVRPMLGRGFRRTDFSLEEGSTAILSFSAWRRHFDERTDVVGTTVMLDGQPVTILGVMPETFREPEFVDVWLPFPVEAPENLVRDSRFWTTVGRLAPDASLASARTEATVIARGLAVDNPATNRGWDIAAQPLLETRVSGIRSSLVLLSGAVVLVLLIASVNLANLMLARGVARSQEFAVRLALGATPQVLARGILWESVVLSLCGGALGMVFATGALHLITTRLPAGLIPRSHALTVDGPAIGFALVASLATAGLFGVLPAWNVARANVNETLKSAGSRGSSGRFAARAQGLLIVGQVTLTVVVLASAGLLFKSLMNLKRAPLGLDPAHVLALRISPPQARWEDFSQLADYYERVLTEVRREPGVEAAAINCSAPLNGITLRYPFWVEGRPAEEGNADEAVFNSVSEDYFRVLRVPLLRGRVLTAADERGTRPVCLINHTLARRLFGDADPIGKRIRTLPWMLSGFREIVGVVADVKQDSASDLPTPQIYVPQRQSPWFFTTVLVRANAVSAATLQAAIRRADPTLTMTVRTLDEAIERTATQPRLQAVLFGWFAAAAVGLSAFGIYASVSFTVGQRTREIGVRLALGATPVTILQWVLAHAGRLALVGVVIGVLVALGTGRLLRTALFEVTPFDPLVLGGLVVLVPLFVVTAAFAPALRGARLPPTRALQAE